MEIVRLAMYQRFGALAQIGEERRADDEEEIFKEAEIEEDEGEVNHHAAHNEEEAEGGALAMLKEPIGMHEPAEVAHGDGGRCPEEINADTEKDRIEYPGYQDPFPELMFRDEMVRFDVTLERYNDFFEHEQVKRTYL
jgi:hypothetical protein